MAVLQTILTQNIEIPEDYALVTEQHESRNGREVTILRFQKAGEFKYNSPRITAVFEGETLISLKNYTAKPTGALVSHDRARELAEKFFQKTNRSYARDLSFIRIENQLRSFISTDGTHIEFPVQWIKFGHRNGSYNWVTLGGDGKVVEMEIDSRWDYFRGRRKTEMWDNDDWVLAREGLGPQLASPDALA